MFRSAQEFLKSSQFRVASTEPLGTFEYGAISSETETVAPPAQDTGLPELSDTHTQQLKALEDSSQSDTAKRISQLHGTSSDTLLRAYHHLYHSCTIVS